MYISSRPAGAQGATGVAIGALASASVTAMTIYEMCKAFDRGINIGDVRLLHKSNGRSGEWYSGQGKPAED